MIPLAALPPDAVTLVLAMFAVAAVVALELVW
jgi:hypothetical protein